MKGTLEIMNFLPVELSSNVPNIQTQVAISAYSEQLIKGGSEMFSI